MKRNIFLSIACLCGIIAAQAEPEPFGTNLQWEIVNDTLFITSPDPSQPAQMTYTSEWPWEASATTITRVELPDNLTDIGQMAFTDCVMLKSIDLPDVTVIREYAFYGCSSLPEITLPASLQEIKSNAFQLCSHLEHVYCLAATPPALNVNDVFAGCAGTLAICVPSEAALIQYRAADVWKTLYYDDLQVCEKDEPTDIQTIDSSSLHGDDRGRLIIENNHLLILRNNEKYTIDGKML